MSYVDLADHKTMPLRPSLDAIAARAPLDATIYDDARRDLARWLLSPAVARHGEDGSIAVVNWLSPDDDVHDGTYPEIGGYYLSFLAQVADLDAPAVTCRAMAEKVLRWFDRADGTPATIERRRPRVGDWRNDCLFTFDLAMIVRGMMAVDARWPGIVAPTLLSRYADAAMAIGVDGRLGSHLLRGDSAMVVPVKWSTQVDVHHVKAAAALGGLDHGVAALAEATLAAWRAKPRQAVRELHPALYFIEGWLIAWARSGDRGDLRHAAEMFVAVLETLHVETADLPAVAGHGYAGSRGDAQAQLLRAGLILDRADALDAAATRKWRGLVDQVAMNVVDRIAPQGGVTFDRTSGHRNSWASMFAWQALALMRFDRGATSIDDASRLI